MTLAWALDAAGPAAPTPMGLASATASAPAASARLPEATDPRRPDRLIVIPPRPWTHHSRLRYTAPQEGLARPRTGHSAASGDPSGRPPGSRARVGCPRDDDERPPARHPGPARRRGRRRAAVHGIPVPRRGAGPSGRSGSMPSPTGTSTPADPYQVGVGGLGAFNYTPPIARLFGPFGALEWPTFLWLWLALLVGNIIWLGGAATGSSGCWRSRRSRSSSITATSTCGSRRPSRSGFRYPWTWGFVLLTKVTPGVGLLWFAVRREWRALAIALGVTGAIVAVSLVARGPALGRLAGVHRLDAGRRLGRPVPDPDPALDPPAGRGRARRVGRPDRPALDGRRGGDAGAARAVGQRLRDLRGAGERATENPRKANDVQAAVASMPR